MKEHAETHRERKPALADETERRLLRDLDGYTADRLPPMDALCRRYGVSRCTLAAAMKALERRGVLLLSQGRCARLRREVRDPVAPPSASTAQRLCDTIAERIAGGVYAAGRALPKTLYLAAEQAVCRRTVSTALKMSRTRGLIHRTGNRWIVGTPRRARTGGDHAVILLVQPSPRRWEGLLTDRTRPFVDAFMAECRANDVHLLPCTVGKGLRVSMSTQRSEGSVANAVSAVGARYLGCIVVGLAREYGDLHATLSALLKHRGPVVWFDTAENVLERGIRTRHLHHCRFSERAIATTAVRFLGEMGHETVAYLGGVRGWQGHRGKLLEEEGARSEPPLRLIRYEERMRRLKAMGKQGLAESLGALWRRRPGAGAKMLAHMAGPRDVSTGILSASGRAAWLARLAEVVCGFPDTLDETNSQVWIDGRDRLFAPVAWDMGRFSYAERLFFALTDPAVTALVVQRDKMASSIYPALMDMGIRVPEDISLISFDNTPWLMTLPVSTVDIGADNLGYRAFHAIYRDIPVRRNREGALVALPKVVHRGSVRQITRKGGGVS